VGKNPTIIFTLNAPNAKSGVMLPTEPARITPASNGDFTAPLQSTTDMHDDAWYSVAIQWLDAAGEYKKIDFPDWALQVPTSGGSFSDLFGRPPRNTRMVYVSLTPPDDPRPFMLWLEQDPNDLENPLNTGVLYEWRNA
jgi:hypothetical protein